MSTHKFNTFNIRTLHHVYMSGIPAVAQAQRYERKRIIKCQMKYEIE